MRTKEEMAAYQRKRRAGLKGSEDCPECARLRLEIEELKRSHLVVLGGAVIKTKTDAETAVSDLGQKRVAHSPTCSCLMCKPFKK
jgi:hypothetical protein